MSSDLLSDAISEGMEYTGTNNQRDEAYRGSIGCPNDALSLCLHDAGPLL